MDLTGVRVLVVDDHQDSLDIEQELLEWAGAEVVVCSTAAEAREAWSHARQTHARFDVIVSDLMIPDHGAAELLRAIRAGGDPTPALGLCSWPDGLERDAVTAGFDRFLEKPVETEVLIRVVGELAGLAPEAPAPRRRARQGATTTP